MDMLAACRTALHIRNTTAYDDMILDWIEEAKAELARSGVDPNAASDDTKPLVRSAIKAYCQMRFTEDEKKLGMYRESFEFQQEQLRKSSGYKAVRNE